MPVPSRNEVLLNYDTFFLLMGRAGDALMAELRTAMNTLPLYNLTVTRESNPRTAEVIVRVWYRNTQSMQAGEVALVTVSGSAVATKDQGTFREMSQSLCRQVRAWVAQRGVFGADPQRVRRQQRQRPLVRMESAEGTDPVPGPSQILLVRGE